jgi:DNA-binding NarL/FixJ family response regulator
MFNRDIEMKVLLADDSVMILERLKELLSIYEQAEIVASLRNGTETLEAIRVLKPDLAIVDIKMPGLSGLDVLYEIRKENKIIKFIILTLYASDYYRQLAIKSGADYFFNKAEDFEKVSHVVDGIMRDAKNDTKLKFQIE